MPFTPHRTRLLTRLAFAFTALTLWSLSARAAEPADQKADDLKEIRNLLSRIEMRLATQQSVTDVMLDIVKKDLRDLREEVSRLQRELADVRSRASTPPAAPTTTSNYGGTPSTSLSVGPPAPTATLRLVNTHFIDMTALINGTLVTVPPGAQRTVTVPAGVVNYQVFQVPEPMKSRTLVPNETLTLQLYPR
jgi:hypothetical protein